MKTKNVVIPGLLFLTILISCANTEKTPPGEHSPKAPESNPGKVLELTVHGQSLEDNLHNVSPDREVLVYLPPGYDESDEKRYPTVYVLHGFGGSARAWFSEDSNGPNVQKAMDSLVAQNEITEMILVVPDTNSRYIGSWYINSPVSGNWEDFITKDLVNYVDTNFKTIKNRDFRGIAGHSMGGYGAFRLAMRNPDIFSVMYSMSPPMVKNDKSYLSSGFLQPEENWSFRDYLFISFASAVTYDPGNKDYYITWPMTDEAWDRWNTETLVEAIPGYKNNLEQLTIKIDMGTYDSLRYYMNDLTGALNDAEIDHIYEEYQAGHVDGLDERVRDAVFQFFSGVWAGE